MPTSQLCVLRENSIDLHRKETDLAQIMKQLIGFLKVH